jgi:hypothetical protein
MNTDRRPKSIFIINQMEVDSDVDPEIVVELCEKLICRNAKYWNKVDWLYEYNGCR